MSPEWAKGEQMETSVHAIGDRVFSVSLENITNGECVVLDIKVGMATVKVFFHDDKIDRALHDIDTAIRSFLMERNRK